MKIIDTIQGSQEWLNIRGMYPTASNFDKILTPTGHPSKQAEKYMYQLVGNRISGYIPETFKSQAMQDGTEKEPKARILFEVMTDLSVHEVGFCLHDSGMFGGSPDGLINDDCGIEIKSPLAHTHIEYLLANKVPTCYISQVQGYMLICDLSHYYFMSYYHGIKPLIINVPRDDKYCAALKVELESFCQELDKLEKRIREING